MAYAIALGRTTAAATRPATTSRRNARDPGWGVCIAMDQRQYTCSVLRAGCYVLYTCDVRRPVPRAPHCRRARATCARHVLRRSRCPVVARGTGTWHVARVEHVAPSTLHGARSQASIWHDDDGGTSRPEHRGVHRCSGTRGTGLGQPCPALKAANPDGNYIVPGVMGAIRYSRDLSLDAYVQRGAGRRPSVVVVHGGSWSSGSRAAHVGQILELLTAAGYNWFSIDYRLGGLARYDDSLGTFAPRCRSSAAARASSVSTAIGWCCSARTPAPS